MEDKIKELRKEKWYDVQFTIEALAVDKEVVEKALKTHIDKMGKIKDIFVYDTKFLDILKAHKPMKNVEEAYSQVAKVRFFSRDLLTLLNIVMVYGPSSVEILGSDKAALKISEVQQLSNTVAGLVHQFAAAGVGGIVITPDK